MARESSPPRGSASSQQVGRYQIISHIASGGMGAVYLAFDPVLNRNVALKVMSPDMAARPNMVQRFQREAKAAAKLKHENIVQIFDFGEAAGIFYLALEFVEGTDLEDYIEQRPGGRLEVEETIAVAIQAAKALDHAYSQDIVHRDIKPSNFLVTTRGGKLFIKLTDMGLAREADDSRITRDNTTLGTVEYISPEQARDAGSADTRSDLYSLGCSIFHMLVGHAPFPKGTLIEKVQHHLSTPPPDVRAHRSDVSDHIANVLFKLLAKDPDERYETPLHLLHDLMLPTEFEEYLKDTQELTRPVFRPPVHHKRTIEPTVQLPLEELLPPPDPLFPAGIRGEAATVLTPPEPPALPSAPMLASAVVRSSGMKLPPLPGLKTGAATTEHLSPLQRTETPRFAPLRAAEPKVVGKASDPPAAVDTAVRAAPDGSETRPTKPANGASDKRTRAAEPSPSAKSKSEPKKPARGKRPRTASPAAQERLRRLEKRRLWRSPLWVGGIVGGLLFAAFGVWATTLLFSRPTRPDLVAPDLTAFDDEPRERPVALANDEPKKTPPVKVAVAPVVAPPVEPIRVEPMPAIPRPIDISKIGPEAPAPKSLTKETDKIDVAALEREYAGPHGEFPKTPNDVVVLRVTRGVAAQADSFPVFADAWRDAGKRASAVLEIHDRGPLAIPSLPPLGAAQVTIRAAPGIRPLLVWDKKPGDKSADWMPLERGSLILEDVDLLVRDDTDEPAACFALNGGDASARNVNLFQADPAKGSIALFRLTGRGALAQRKGRNGAILVAAEAGQLARLESCFLRGPGVMAAHVSAVNADLLIDRSLVVGKRQPAFSIVGQGGDIANVRALRSTIASAKAIVHFQPAEGQAIAPRLGFFSLDALLSNPGPNAGGAILSLDESVGTSGLAAKIANSAFAGWPTLLRARQTSITTLAEWRTQWGHRDGDATLPECWPAIPGDDFDRVIALNCSPLASSVAFASLKGDALTGCPVGYLPPEPPAWRLLPPASLPVAALDLPEAIAPVIEPGNDGLFHGEVLDLNKISDLGDYLNAQKLAPRVVVHLAGRGTFKSSPLRLRGTRLTMYALPADAPILDFQTFQGVPAATLFDVESGSLDMINIRVRLDWKKLGETPASIFRVRDGQLSMARCVVQSPLTRVPDAFNSLAVVESVGGPAKFTCRDCVFLTGASFVSLEGAAASMRCNQSLVLALDDAVVLKPGEFDAPPSASVRFDNNTLVLDKAFLRIHAPPRPPGSSPPIPIHSLDNYFSGTTPGGNALLLRAEGDALARGLIAWHGDGNAFDPAAFPRAVAWGRDASSKPFPQAWADIWGHAAERDLLLVPAKQPPLKALNLEQPNFDRFILPTSLRLDLPGAHMQQLIPLFLSTKKK
jgi:serine/threonine protein kinase